MSNEFDRAMREEIEDSQSSHGRAERRMVGKISPSERDEIRSLFERKNGLSELFRSLSNMSRSELETSALYDRLISDMGEVATRFQAWWEAHSVAYGWESLPDHQWEVDFDSCAVFLRKK